MQGNIPIDRSHRCDLAVIFDSLLSCLLPKSPVSRCHFLTKPTAPNLAHPLVSLTLSPLPTLLHPAFPHFRLSELQLLQPICLNSALQYIGPTPLEVSERSIYVTEGRIGFITSKVLTSLVTCDLAILFSRYRGKTYRATVKIVRTSDQVADFCRRVCAKLECCPNLFSPVLVAEVCPENCSIHTKTKYSEYPLKYCSVAIKESVRWEDVHEMVIKIYLI